MEEVCGVAGETMLKNKPHLVKFYHCIIGLQPINFSAHPCLLWLPKFWINQWNCEWNTARNKEVKAFWNLNRKENVDRARQKKMAKLPLYIRAPFHITRFPSIFTIYPSVCSLQTASVSLPLISWLPLIWLNSSTCYGYVDQVVVLEIPFNCKERWKTDDQGVLFDNAGPEYAHYARRVPQWFAMAARAFSSTAVATQIHGFF